MKDFWITFLYVIYLILWQLTVWGMLYVYLERGYSGYWSIFAVVMSFASYRPKEFSNIFRKN